MSSARSSRRSRRVTTRSPWRVHDGSRVTAVWPGLREHVYGVAIDVGSTTIAGHLVNLSDGAVLASAGVMNPQIRFGEDLMSRVSYAMLHPGGATEMTKAVRVAINGLLGSLLRTAGLRADDLLEIALVGNPIMHHLVFGIDPVPLGSAPFALATDRAIRVPATEIGLAAHPGPASMPCPSSPAMSAPTPRVSSSPRRPIARRASRSSSTSVPTPRSSWATATGSSQLPRPPAPRSRAPRSRRASEPPRVRSSASGSTGRRSSPGSRSSAPTSGRTTRASAPPSPRAG